MDKLQIVPSSRKISGHVIAYKFSQSLKRVRIEAFSCGRATTQNAVSKAQLTCLIDGLIVLTPLAAEFCIP